MKASLLTLALLTLAACGGKDDPDDSGDVDADGDGFTASDDCDDADAAVNPGAAEVCDAVDNNCDGAVDEGVTLTVWPDSDGDGYGDGSAPQEACAAGSGFVEDDQDCDDSQATAYPGAVEVCDGLDNDCDGATDDADSNLDRATASVWYLDADGDGFGDAESELVACDAPSGYVTDDSDCDDDDTYVYPGAYEACDGVDNDCDPSTTEDGVVTAILSDGSPVDVTEDLTGTESAPLLIELNGEATLRFCDGTYYFSLSLPHSANIEGLNGPESTILNAAGAGPALFTTADGVDLSISGVTLTGGSGWETSLHSSGNVGGGLACEAAGSTTLTLDNVAIIGNEAETGGGLYAQGCELSVTGSDISGNVANSAAGGVYIQDGTHEFTDTTITGNSSASYAGGMYVEGYSDYLTILLDDVDMSDNEAVNNAGGLAAYASYVTWVGTNNPISGPTNNTIGGGRGGGMFLWLSEFSGSLVDLGEDSEDNSRNDIWVADVDFHYHAGDDLHFSCNTQGCGTPADYSLGGTGSSNHYNEILKGNVFEPTGSATIDEFSVYLNPDASCTLDFYVLTDTNIDDDWDVAWSSLGQTGSGAAYYSSGPIGIAVEEGTYYGLLVGAMCSTSADETVYYYETNSIPTNDGGFGTSVARFDDVNDYSASFSGTANVNTYDSSNLRYAMTVTVTEL